MSLVETALLQALKARIEALERAVAELQAKRAPKEKAA